MMSRNSSSSSSSFDPKDGVPSKDLFDDDDIEVDIDDEEYTDETDDEEDGIGEIGENSKNDSFSYEVDTSFNNAGNNSSNEMMLYNAAAAENTTSHQTQLSDQDRAVVQQYRFMLQMGLPNDAVIAKMVEANVQPHIMTAVLKTNNANNNNNHHQQQQHQQQHEEYEEEVEEESYSEEEDASSSQYDQQQQQHEQEYSGSQSQSSSYQEQKPQSSSSTSQYQLNQSLADFSYAGTTSRNLQDDSSRECDPLMELTESGMSQSSASSSQRSSQSPDLYALQETSIPEQQDYESTEEEVIVEETEDDSSLEEVTVLEGDDDETREIFSDEHHKSDHLHHDDLEQPLPPQRQSTNKNNNTNYDSRNNNNYNFNYHDKKTTIVRRQFAILMILVSVMCFALITVVGVILALYLSSTDDETINQSNNNNNDRINSLPTASPTGPTVSPTTSPTLNPPPSISLESQQTFTGSVNSKFGTSAISKGNWLAIGMPNDDNGRGAVITYQRATLNSFNNDNNHADAFEHKQTLIGPTSAAGIGETRYGTSLAFSNPIANNPFLVVGAPLAPSSNTTSVPTGAAYFYVYNRGDQTWKLEGNTILGGTGGAASIGQAFGTSVATSDAYRVVVGAPLYGGNNIGRVYTFSFGQISGTSNFDWMPVKDELIGSQSNALFGKSIDITSDGNTMIVGVPGMSRFQIYEWNADDGWKLMFAVTRSNVGDLGSQVKFLSSNTVAVGAPSAQQSKGMVAVFQRKPSDDAWIQVGTDLLGDTTGQRLGNSLSGRARGRGQDDEGEELILVTGTAIGTIHRFDWSAGGQQWVERFNTNVVGSGSASSSSSYPITSVDLVEPGIAGSGSSTATTAGSTSIVVGLAFADTAILFQEKEVLSQPPTAPSPSKLKDAVLSFKEEAGDPDVNFGQAVAWTGNMVGIGMPFYQSAGAIQPYQWSNNNSTFGKTNLVTPPSTPSNQQQFGTSLDMGVATNGQIRMSVAFVGTTALFNPVTYGAAYYYEYSSSSGAWNVIGGMIGDDKTPILVHTSTTTSSYYGPTVAMASTIRRVVLGISSHGNSAAMSAGRILTYDYIGSQWLEVGPGPLTGTSGSYMGASMDMSVDGNKLVVGAPGGSGNVQFFNWAPGLWFQIATIPGIAGEALGTSVAFINPQGTQFVSGAPNFFAKRGVVRVYGQSTPPNGPLTLVGNQILGQPGEMIGTTVCGKNGRIAFGTSTGSFRVYDFDGTSWVQVKNGGGTTNSMVVSIAMSDDAMAIAVGYANEVVQTFDLTGL